MARHNRINHKENIGKKYSRLTILEVDKKGKDYYYKCQCECGNIIYKKATNILYNFTKSCGCLQKEKMAENARKIGLKNRIYDNKCSYCGKEKHYAKGLCRNCYCRLKRNGKVEYKKMENK